MVKKTPLIVGGVAAVVIVVVLALYIRSVAPSFAPPPPAKVGPVGVTLTLDGAGTSSYDEAKSYGEYALAGYTISNADAANLSLYVYAKQPILPIYFLNVSSSECDDCYSSGATLSALSAYLHEYGLIRNASSLETININQLQSLPGNAVLIIDTGLMPLGLLPNTTSGGTNIVQLIRRGDTIIYVGLNFTQSINPGGTTQINTAQTLSTLAAADLDFGYNNGASVTNSSGLYFDSPTFNLHNGFTYGYVTSASTSALNGTLIAFSNEPRKAWPSVNESASDIATVIASRYWLPLVAYGTTTLPVSSSNATGTSLVFTFNRSISLSGQNSLSSIEPVVNSSYALLSVRAFNSTAFATQEVPFRVTFSSNGSIELPSVVGQTQLVTMSVFFAPSVTSISVPHVDLYNSSLDRVYTVPLGFFNTSLGVSKSASFALPSGTYLAEVRDVNNRYYSSAAFTIAPTVINPVDLNFQNGTFVFTLTSDNQPISNTTYTISLNGAYNESGTLANGVLTYVLPKGTTISYGNQVFRIGLFGTVATYAQQYQAKGIVIQPIYIEFGIAALVIVLINVILRPPNRDDYFIDVPDFQPTKHVAVKLPGDTVISVFDKVNAFYRWRFMPLTADEIKSGISTNLRHDTIPVSITMQNCTTVLTQLVAAGKLENFGDYYAPKKWVQESGHDIEYLIVFRKLRDYFVSHAIMFSDLDVDKVADTLITKGGIQSEVYIYSGEGGIRPMRISRVSRVFAIFLNEESRLQFMDKLYTSYGEEAELLKTGIAYNYIRLVDTEHLDQLLL